MTLSAPNDALDRLGPIEAAVAAFEDGSLPLAVWQAHTTHLLVALWYLRQMPAAAATERICQGIQAYNRIQGIRQTPNGGYHESMTRFFIHQIRHFLAQADEDRSFEHLARELLARPMGKRLVLAYYSRERILSWVARTGWVEPDLLPLPPLWRI